MDFTGKKLLNKLIAIVAILAMTLSDFVLVGANLVSYAEDVATTTSKNVEFTSYFVEANEAKVSKIEKNTDATDLKMYVEVSVKNEGYLDGGEISLENSNFKIKNKILSDSVSKIEENKVYLNRISAGKTVIIELEIEKSLPDTMPESLLKAETNVVLQGNYFDSKSIQTQKPQTISGKSKIEIDWKSGENVKAETDLKLLTNKIFEIQGEQKRIVQLLLTSKVTNNNYPVKNTRINIASSQGAETATVIARSTAATNSNATLTQNYNGSEGKITIEVANNTVNGNIQYNKNATDSFVITYVYPANIEYEGTEIVANTEITTLDNSVKSAENKITLQNEVDGIITYEVESDEKEMYKGKIYTGEARDYQSTTRINVNKAGIAEKIEINELETAYRGMAHTGASIFYTKTKISKAEFDKIFGAEGYVKFIDNNNGTVIANINSNSQVDESGNIVINYPENIKIIKIETSKPIAEGTIDFINTKTIKEEKYDREQIKEFQEITEIVRGKYKDEEEFTIQNHIALKDTSSKAKVTMTNTSLSTTEKTNTRLQITLETDDESKDLYKNPTIKITLPKQVIGYEYNAQLLNANGLKIENKGKSKEGDNLVINFELAGEQTKYVTDITKGTSLVLDFVMEQDKLATTSKEEIKVNYTNENATIYADGGEEKVGVNIIAKNPIITTNKINELNIQTSTEERKDIELEVESEEKTLTQVMDIVNNETNKIKDVKILGKYPVNTSKNNLGITIKTPASSITQKEGVKIYYSTAENPTNDLTNSNNKWSEQQDLTAKTYLIVIPSLEVGEKYTFGYKMNIPANLTYNLSAEAGYEVSYTNSASNTQNTVKATTLELNTGKAAMIEQTVVATVGGDIIKDGDTVKTGEIIKYTVTVKNEGNEDATKVNVTANIPEGTNYIEYNKNISLPENPTLAATPETLIEDTQRKEIKYENATIKAKSQKSFEYMVIVKSNQSKQTEFTLKVTDSANKVKETKIKHNIENSDIKVTVSKLDSIYNESIKSGCNYRYKVIVENMSNKEIKDLAVAIDTNSIMNFGKAYYIDSNKKVKETENKNLDIDKIASKGKVEITIEVTPKQPTNEVKEAELFATVSLGNNKSRSNKLIEKVDAIELNIQFTSTSSTKTEGYLHSGEEVKYILNIKNEGKNDANTLTIKDQISDYLELQDVTINDKKAEYSREEVYKEKSDYSIITIKSPLKAGETANIVITANVKDGLQLKELVKVTNKATLYNGIELAKTEEIIYFIEKTENDEENKEPNTDENKQDNGKQDESKQDEGKQDEEKKEGENNKEQGKNSSETPSTDVEKGKYTITGTAWKDTNENGARDKGEELLAEVSVKLLDIQNKKYLTDSSGKEIVAKTNQEGLYNITNIPEGKYIAIFEYDSNKYMLTTYKAEEVANDRNSDVILNTISINGEQKLLATSDTLEIKNSIANIDIGLLDAKVFDIELQKYITKIVVTNNEGTSTYDYKDANLAKVDIAAKNLKDSQVVVEYTIRVKNAGEIAGYVKNVVDYKSTELSFSSTLNKDWYSMGDNLYNASLANSKLEPGETKELKLILTKTMTESNTGLIANTAEIAEAYNTRGMEDKDSTPGNKVNKEDDMGQADLIIGVKTGAAISYILITLSIIVVIGVAGYLVSKKVLSKEIKFE